MKKLIGTLAIMLIAGCGSEEVEQDFEKEVVISEPVEPGATETAETTGGTEILEETETPVINMGTFNYSGKIPGEASKVPTCKEGVPAFVHFDFIDAEGNQLQRESRVTLQGGLWVSQKDSLPVGTYSVTNTVLMSDSGEPLYALPNQDEPDFTDYVESTNSGSEPTIEQLNNGILPIDIEVAEIPVTISGTALCYIPSEIEVEGGFGPGIGTKQLQTLVVYITGQTSVFQYTNDDGTEVYEDEGCVDIVYVVVDGYTVIERYTYSGGVIRYPLIVPTDYDTMTIYTSDDQSAQSNITQSYSFTKEDPYDPGIDGALLFDKCDPQQPE